MTRGTGLHAGAICAAGGYGYDFVRRAGARLPRARVDNGRRGLAMCEESGVLGFQQIAAL